MVFPHEGENHRDGVQNELNFVKNMNSNPDNDISKHIKKSKSIDNDDALVYRQAGGTQTKTDCIIEKYGIPFSIKNHKGGTFDYTNTTTPIDTNLRKKIKEYKDENINKPINSIIRREISKILSTYLNEIESNTIKQILKDIYEKYPDWILINDVRTKTYNLIHKTYLIDTFMSEHTYFLKSTRATSSRQIWIVDSNGNETNTHLRMRVVLNNGVNALLGQSSKNKTSVPCMKIQQDKVQLFLKNCENKVTTTY